MYDGKMQLRPFQARDAPALARLASSYARGETDFVLHPLWETPDELHAEFALHGIAPEDHLLVADGGDGRPLGMAGILRFPGETAAAVIPPVVERQERGKGVGGELLRASLELAKREGVKLASAAVGSRNRSGYALLAAHGFRPVRQHFFMRAAGELAPPGKLPDGVTLDAARHDDATAIHELYSDADFPPRAPDATRRALADGRHAHAVARRAGSVVGFVELDTHWPERPFVAFVGVDRSLRDRGLGTGLVRYALERAFSAGARTAQLLLSPANRAALRAYEKVGFKRFRLLDVLEKGL